MTKHLHRDMESIHREILDLSTRVEDIIDKASLALCERKYEFVPDLIQGDEEIDRREVHIEEECLKILALHQPVAVDLRRIVIVLKVNHDLERIADLAANIAERAQSLEAFPEFPIPVRLKRMADLATMMVRAALDAFVNLDSQAARRICKLDDEVDRYNCDVIDELQSLMLEQPPMIVPSIHCFSAARNVERIADHAANIAEDVIYLVEGEIARHKHGVVPSPQPS